MSKNLTDDCRGFSNEYGPDALRAAVLDAEPIRFVGQVDGDERVGLPCVHPVPKGSDVVAFPLACLLSAVQVHTYLYPVRRIPDDGRSCLTIPATLRLAHDVELQR